MKRRSFLMSSLGLTAAYTTGAHLFAAPSDSTGDIVRIEEDWYININYHNSTKSSPQILLNFGPYNTLDGLFATLEFNHTTIPSFSAGGMSLQCWNGSAIYTTPAPIRRFAGVPLRYNNEVITFTTVVDVTGSGNTTAIQVINGQSSSWGTFGGSTMLMSVNANINNLNSWLPSTSINNSDVLYGGNRVAMFQRTEIRYQRKGSQIQRVKKDETVFAWV